MEGMRREEGRTGGREGGRVGGGSERGEGGTHHLLPTYMNPHLWLRVFTGTTNLVRI